MLILTSYLVSYLRIVFSVFFFFFHFSMSTLMTISCFTCNSNSYVHTQMPVISVHIQILHLLLCQKL